MDTESETWRLRVFPDAATASEAAADLVATSIQTNPDAAISVPTGSTPLAMFDILAARAARGEIDFSRVHFFCLDEYVGVTIDDPNSLTRWLWKALLTRIGARPDRVYPLPANVADPSTATVEFERLIIARGGLELAILGLGPNGHIAYNEPGSGSDSRTRVIALTPESRSQALAYWEGAVPTPDRAMTMGVGTLLEAKQIVLLVTGASKADMLRRSLEEPMNASVPASWLRIAGQRLTVIADEAAAGELTTAPSR